MFVSRCLDVVVLYVAVQSAELYCRVISLQFFFETCLLFVKCESLFLKLEMEEYEISGNFVKNYVKT